MESLFMIVLGVSSLSLLLAVVTAFIGLFAKNEKAKHDFNGISTKSILVFGLTFVVGFGVCVMMF